MYINTLHVRLMYVCQKVSRYLKIHQIIELKQNQQCTDIKSKKKEQMYISTDLKHIYSPIQIKSSKTTSTVFKFAIIFN